MGGLPRTCGLEVIRLNFQVSQDVGKSILINDGRYATVVLMLETTFGLEIPQEPSDNLLVQRSDRILELQLRDANPSGT